MNIKYISMKIGKLIYPGFNRSFEELSSIKVKGGNLIEIVDFTDIEWVRSAIKELIKEKNGDIEIKFKEASEKEILKVSEIVGAGKTPEEAKNEFNNGKRIIGIASGKGGVGKSTLSSLLALAFSEQGKKVGILDADIWGFSIPKMLGAKFPPIPFNNRIFPSKINKLNVISMEYFVKQDEAVIWRGPMLHKAIEQFLYEVLWQDIDILLIDMPPGTGDVSISLSQFLNFYETIIVTTPQSNATVVAERAGIMSRKVNSSIIGVIENMSHIDLGDTKLYPFGKGGGEALSENLKVPLIGQLPLIEDVSKLSEKGRLNDFVKDDLFQNVLDLSESINKIGPKKKPISLKVK
jgi:ATP-binding protein involved in chromosome partitioning